MRSKAPLVLMEQIVMLLVFALAAAICLQAFVKSDQLSQASAARDQAVIMAQNTAEQLKSLGADGHVVSGVHISYDANWQTTNAADACYTLVANPSGGALPGLGQANIQVIEVASGRLLYELRVAWQQNLAGGESS